MFIYYLQLATKSLRKTLPSTVLMVFAIALGIGLSMTALTLNHVRGTNPIPEKSAQLYSLQLQASGKSSTWSQSDNMPVQVTYQDAINIMKSNQHLRHTGMYKTGFAVRSMDPEFAPMLYSARVTNRHFFAMFNIDFLYGASWSEEIDLSPDYQVVISDTLNQKLFGGGDNTGKSIMLDNRTYRIVGITKEWAPAPKFYDLNNGGFQSAEQIFIPLSLAPTEEFPSWGNNNGWKDERVTNFQEKMQSETMWFQYWVELNSPQEKEEFELYLEGYIADQKKLARFEREDARGVLRNVEQWLEYLNVEGDDSNVLVGVSFMFLAVCLVNTIGLLLAKFLKSAPEVGVRRALGANKEQVFIQHLVEVGMLGLIGGVVGLALANIGLFILRSQFDGFDVIATMDWKMLAAAPVIAISATVIAGIYPAWRVCKTLPSVYLKTQ